MADRHNWLSRRVVMEAVMDTQAAEQRRGSNSGTDQQTHEVLP